ncbi:MAG: hypothetical protein JXB85_09730 [Anaerolineales bacterium]|nr:hypothetical protein [Anaerolineales bacterium]
MPELLNAEIKKQVSDLFAELKDPVEIIFFGSEEKCTYCADTRHLAEELASLSEKLNLTVYDLQADAESASRFKVDKVPTLILAARDGEVTTDLGVHFAGIPAGHEFSSLIQSLVLVSNRDSGLSPQTREFLRGLKDPVHMQVFVTPT